MTQRNRGGAWLYILLSTSGLLLIVAAIYFAGVPFLSPSNEPDKDIVESELARALPPFVKVTGTALREVKRDRSQPGRVFDVRFIARGEVRTTAYLGRRVENGVLFLSDPAVPGMQISLTGSAVVRRIGDSWTTELTIHPQPILQAVTRAEFPRQRVIVQGSPEEAVYLGQRKHAPAGHQPPRVTERGR
jgi:hypothetical protein